jgi:hypothetical protein
MSKEQVSITADLEIKNIVEPQLNIILTTDEDDERPVFISGNFNNWVTQDKKFEMEKVGHGLYHYKFENDFVYVLITPSL